MFAVSACDVNRRTIRRKANDVSKKLKPESHPDAYTHTVDCGDMPRARGDDDMGEERG